ncbi:hypothetical protein NHX12_023790 [Muraenolepis orangiensis]|uniref:Uncharacterized protein n=1 Tax=Muraenolepis orangiensis TaxID=630683 RepID=A0A9Q0IU55_9TELE|nr:hypothetical protein NHX12_023790 [Muraenolepis orangiensis]
MNGPAAVELTYEGLRFLITHNPTNATLNKAPVWVVLPLIETRMEYEDAVQFIRLKRRGAFNCKQFLYQEKYRPKMRLRFKDANGGHNGGVQEALSVTRC